MNDNAYVYRVDRQDIILLVSHNWDSFAQANACGRECRGANVVGHRLWDFIEGDETRHLYEEVFRRVRAGKFSRPIPFRCDSPRERRFLELVLVRLPEDQIELTSTIIRAEYRDPVYLLNKSIPRTHELIRICSMCKKMATRPETWVEIEEGLIDLKIFEARQVPGLTHCICPACYEVALAELDDRPPSGRVSAC